MKSDWAYVFFLWSIPIIWTSLLKNKKYVLLIGGIQKIYFYVKWGIVKKIYWNVTFEKDRFLDFMSLLCKFSIENFRVIWLAFVIDHWFSYRRIVGSNFWLNWIGLKSWWFERVVTWLWYEWTCGIKRWIRYNLRRRNWFQNFFSTVININFSGDIVGVAVC